MSLDIACIVFVCVTMNHLGLISAIEGVIGRRLVILDCPKCATFWSVLAYTLFNGQTPILSLAISFLAGYSSIWVELFEGIIDTIYSKVYETIYSDTENDTASAVSSDVHTASSVS